MLIACNDKSELASVKGELSKQFEMKDLGEAHMCLELELTRDRANKTLHVSQPHYANKVLERFGMEKCKPVVTPMEGQLGDSDDDNLAKDVPYREVHIRGISYLIAHMLVLGHAVTDFITRACCSCDVCKCQPRFSIHKLL